MNARSAPVVYFVLGQAGWFACVLSAARGAQYLGVTFVVVLIALHLVRVKKPMQELKLLVSVGVIGGAWESALVFFDVLQYPHRMLMAEFAPMWIVGLWGLFAAQFNTTYGWLKHRLYAAALLGAIAGPASFRAGAALGAVQFVKPVPALIILSIGWAVLLPLVTLMSRRWNGAD